MSQVAGFADVSKGCGLRATTLLVFVNNAQDLSWICKGPENSTFLIKYSSLTQPKPAFLTYLHQEPLNLHALSLGQQVSMGSNPVHGTITMAHLEQSPGLNQPTAIDIENLSGTGPLLYQLPTELRSVIFGDCIASGHPQFMQASRVLLEDGQALIGREATYRMHLASKTDNNGQRPSQEMVATIQNLHVTIDMRERGSLGPNLERLQPFGGSHIHRGQCHVVLQVDSTLSVLAGVGIFKCLLCFGGFEKVALLVKEEHLGFPNYWIMSRVYTLVEVLPKWLYPTLGMAEITSKKDGFVMDFHPRKHAEAFAGR